MHSINTKSSLLSSQGDFPRALSQARGGETLPPPEPPSNSYLRRRGSHSSDRVHSPSVSATFDGVLNRTRSLKTS